MGRRDELGPFEREVLEAILAAGANAYGISILDVIETQSKRRPSLGALYSTLERLEKKGLVRSWWGEATAVRGGRRKRLYAIQASGMRALNGETLHEAAIARPPFGLPQGA